MNRTRINCITLFCLGCFTILLAGCASGVLSEPAPTVSVIAAPVISPAAGTYTGSQVITITDSAVGATIYYTSDGSVPSASSPIYSKPFSITATSTVNAFATAPNYTGSSVVSVSYTIVANQTAAPVFTPLPGAYTGATAVTLTDTTPGAAIYYTVDGTTPTSSSTLYSAPIAVAASETISAIGIAAGFGNSNVATGAYTIAAPQAATPTFSPGPGTYSSAQAVTLTDATKGAIVYYTTDGTTPTTASTVYTGPITVSTTEIVSAVAGGPNFTSSPVASASYSIIIPATSAPVFNPPAGAYSATQYVTITDATPNTSIRYTTDGSKPTASSPLYSGPLTVSTSQTLTAIASATGYSTSAASSATYSIGNTQPMTAYTFNNAQIVGGGYVDGIVMHPAQQGLMYARTDVGGAYRWSSTSKQWIPLTDFITHAQGFLLGIESLAIDPSNPDKLYLAAGTYADSYGTNGAILISNDQGQTFTTVPLTIKLGSNDAGRFAGERLNVDPNLGSHLYFGSRLNGLWESKDSGSTWAQVTSFPVGGAASSDVSTTGGVVFEDFVQSSGASGAVTPTVYVGVDDSTVSALYVTTNGGKTWATVAGQPAGLFLNRGALGNDGNLYLSYSNNLGPAGATSGAIWRYTLPTPSQPAGAWKDISPSSSFAYPQATYGFSSVAVDPERPGVIMATTLDLYSPHDDVFRSLDGGNSWIDLGGNQSRDSSLSPWLDFGQTSPGIGNWLTSIVIDPYNSNHVLYGTGETIWQTTNATAADSTTTSAGTTTAGAVPTSWKVGALGIEETVALALVSPPAGASVISGVRDIGGFTHTSLTASPATGMQSNPIFTDTTSLDFAQSQPGMIVRVGDGDPALQSGAYSADGGNTWTPFLTEPTASTISGSIAIAADASTIVWSPSNARVAYSTNNGTSWTFSQAPTNLTIVADRINPLKFYLFDPGQGTLYGSIDGARTFHPLTYNLAENALLRASYAAEGDLWLAGPTGLFHSTNSGASFTQMASIQAAYDVAFGKPASGASYPAIYVYGMQAGIEGVFRSVDSGATWTTVTDPAHQYGIINVIAADPKIFGRVYLGTSGRGIIYADPTP